jgi:putative flavoprotein involved in K+ transport
MESLSVVIVGAGQAGLAVSHELAEQAIEHVIIERGRIGETWRGRWDSFCLVTPNWSVQLPGAPYRGDDPNGFMPRDEIVRYLNNYATSFHPEIREGVAVTSIRKDSKGIFELQTSGGVLRAKVVVLATGAYQRPHRPGPGGLPNDLIQIDAEGYQSPTTLPPGKVLVVGSGQTGCQLAEDLREAGRDVFLSCGRAPWAPRRTGDRDLIYLALESGFLDTPVADLPSPSVRISANIQATGHRGGHDLHYRVLQQIGVTLLGHFKGAENSRAHFAPDLADSVAFGDARFGEIRKLIAKTCAERGIPVPDMPDPPPFNADAPEVVDLDGFGAVIFTSGFRPDYAGWVHLPAFDQMGFPITEDGASIVVLGLYFCGVHFLRKRKSSLLLGFGEDAFIVADKIARSQER